VSEDDFGAWAFDAKTGVELWSARSFIPAGHQNVALAVDAEKGRVFAAGYVESNQGFGINEAFFVRGHDADNGELLWEEQFHTVRCDCRALDILADHGRVFAAGGDGDQTWLIRAYDERLGTVLWHDEFEVPGPPPEVGRGFDATAIAIDGGRLFVVGSALNASGGMDVILRAYDAK
jgi:outer membrane protein assembly factor BamB